MATRLRPTRRRRLRRGALSSAALALVLGSGAGLAASAGTGSPDTSFDRDGILLTGFDPPSGSPVAESANAVLLQPDGKIVAAGSGGTRLKIVRATRGGSLDPTFGVRGKAVPELVSEIDVRRAGLGRQSSGKLVLSMALREGGRLAVLRLNADGSRDEGFGTDGGRLIDVPQAKQEVSPALAVQPDDRIVLAGSGCVGTCYIGSTPADRFIVARTTADGAPDTTFGAPLANGVVITRFDGLAARASAVAVQAGGRIVVAGNGRALYARQSEDFRSRILLARYHADGRLDTSFNGDGKVERAFEFSANAAAVTIQPNGRVLVAGHVSAGGDDRILLMRYRTDGGLDTTFGGNGIVTTALRGYEARASAVAVQPDGKVLVAGNADGSRQLVLLARYLTNGSLDTTFGNGGTLTAAVGRTSAWAEGIALQPDGRVVIAGGRAQSGGDVDFLLMRFR